MAVGECMGRFRNILLLEEGLNLLLAKLGVKFLQHVGPGCEVLAGAGLRVAAGGEGVDGDDAAASGLDVGAQRVDRAAAGEHVVEQDIAFAGLHGAVELRGVGESREGGGVLVTHAGALGDFLVDGPGRMSMRHGFGEQAGQPVFALALACDHGREDGVGVLGVQGFQLGRVDQGRDDKPSMVGAAGFGFGEHFMRAEGGDAGHDLRVAEVLRPWFGQGAGLAHGEVDRGDFPHGALHLRGDAHGAVAGGGAGEGREFLAEVAREGGDLAGAELGLLGEAVDDLGAQFAGRAAGIIEGFVQAALELQGLVLPAGREVADFVGQGQAEGRAAEVHRVLVAGKLDLGLAAGEFSHLAAGVAQLGERAVVVGEVLEIGPRFAGRAAGDGFNLAKTQFLPAAFGVEFQAFLGERLVFDPERRAFYHAGKRPVVEIVGIVQVGALLLGIAEVGPRRGVGEVGGGLFLVAGKFRLLPGGVGEAAVGEVGLGSGVEPTAEGGGEEVGVGIEADQRGEDFAQLGEEFAPHAHEGGVVAGRAAGEPLGIERAHALGKPFFHGQVGIGAQARGGEIGRAHKHVGREVALGIEERAGLGGHFLRVQLAQNGLRLRREGVEERVRHFVQEEAATIPFAGGVGGDHEEALLRLEFEDGGLHVGGHGAAVAGRPEFVGDEAAAQVEVAGERGEFTAQGGELFGDLGVGQDRAGGGGGGGGGGVDAWVARHRFGNREIFIFTKSKLAIEFLEPVFGRCAEVGRRCECDRFPVCVRIGAQVAHELAAVAFAALVFRHDDLGQRDQSIAFRDRVFDTALVPGVGQFLHRFKFALCKVHLLLSATLRPDLFATQGAFVEGVGGGDVGGGEAEALQAFLQSILGEAGVGKDFESALAFAEGAVFSGHRAAFKGEGGGALEAQGAGLAGGGERGLLAEDQVAQGVAGFVLLGGGALGGLAPALLLGVDLLRGEAFGVGVEGGEFLVGDVAQVGDFSRGEVAAGGLEVLEGGAFGAHLGGLGIGGELGLGAAGRGGGVGLGGGGGGELGVAFLEGGLGFERLLALRLREADGVVFGVAGQAGEGPVDGAEAGGGIGEGLAGDGEALLEAGFFLVEFLLALGARGVFFGGGLAGGGGGGGIGGEHRLDEIGGGLGAVGEDLAERLHLHGVAGRF